MLSVACFLALMLGVPNLYVDATLGLLQVPPALSRPDGGVDVVELQQTTLHCRPFQSNVLIVHGRDLPYSLVVLVVSINGEDVVEHQLELLSCEWARK